MARSMRFGRATLAAVGATVVVGALAAGILRAGADDASRAYPAAGQMRFRAITVDVSPLVGNGLGPEAEWVARDLPGQLRAAFAGRLAPGDRAAPTLVVRIDQLMLGASNGNPAQPFGDYGANDEIEGVGMVVAPNGKVVATYPLFSTVNALTGGSVYDMTGLQLRVDQLSNSFAQWLPGKMGL